MPYVCWLLVYLNKYLCDTKFDKLLLGYSVLKLNMEICSGSNYIIKTEIIVPPTYLKELFVDEDDIVLVYDKVMFILI